MSDNEFDPDAYDDDQSYVTDYGRDLLALLDPQPDERVLDVGCGTGHLTAEIAAASGAVLGIDASPAMVDRAREEYPDLAFETRDVTDLTVEEPFDAAFANAALHWITDQDAALAAIADALVDGGRLVAEMGARGNVTSVREAARAALQSRGHDVDNPWYFPTLAEQATRLEEAGFTVRLARTFEREATLDGDGGVRSWLAQFGDELLAGVDDREAAVAGIEDRMRADCYDADRNAWTLTYRRLQFDARKGEHTDR